jgi:hypothetical protein
MIGVGVASDVAVSRCHPLFQGSGAGGFGVGEQLALPKSRTKINKGLNNVFKMAISLLIQSDLYQV